MYRRTSTDHPVYRLGLLMVVLAAGLASVVGSGGGGGGTTPPPVIGIASEYWSANQGDAWLFNGQDTTTSATYRDQVTVGVPLTLGGRTLVPFVYSRPFNDPASAGAQYRSLDAEGIHAYLEDTPSSFSQAYLELPAQIRQETYRAYEQTEVVDGFSLTLTLDVTVLGFEHLVLPAGVFPEALKTRQRFTLTARFLGQTETATVDLNLWYAKGIGVVKQSFSEVGIDAQVEELAGVSVGTVKAGVIGEFTLLDGLTPGGSDLTTGRPGVASDGNGYLVAARRVEPLTSATQIVATYIDANGQPQWSKPIIDLGTESPGESYQDPVAVTFDGANFWVVARSSVLNSTDLIGQRITPAGGLLDGPGGAVLADGLWPVLASDGSSVMLVVARNQGAPTFDWALHATLFERDGAVLHPEQLLVELGSGNSGFAAASANGGQYLVTYEQGEPRHVFAIRIDGTTGVLSDAQPLASTGIGAQGMTAVAPWGDADFVSLWVDSRNYGSASGPFDIVGARISSAGGSLDGLGVPLNIHPSERFGTAAATGARGTLLAWTIGSFASLTTQPTGVFARGFSPTEPFSVPAPTTGGVLVGLLEDFGVRLMAPAASANGEGHLVIWVYNDENFATLKSVRGALVYPPLASP